MKTRQVILTVTEKVKKVWVFDMPADLDSDATEAYFDNYIFPDVEPTNIYCCPSDIDIKRV